MIIDEPTIIQCPIRRERAVNKLVKKAAKEIRKSWKNHPLNLNHTNCPKIAGQIRKALDVKRNEKGNVIGEIKIGNEILKFELQSKPSNIQLHNDNS